MPWRATTMPGREMSEELHAGLHVRANYVQLSARLLPACAWTRTKRAATDNIHHD